MGFGFVNKDKNFVKNTRASIENLNELHTFFKEEVLLADSLVNNLKNEIKHIKEFENELNKFESLVESAVKMEFELMKKMEDLYALIHSDNRKLDVSDLENKFAVARSLVEEIDKSVGLFLSKISFFRIDVTHDLYAENDTNKDILKKLDSKTIELEVKMSMVRSKSYGFKQDLDGIGRQLHQLKQEKSLNKDSKNGGVSENNHKFGF
ncbi:hypothetical protein K9L97_00615 [Candidatus Woesearchaeota archaeon]|nr:hypothetical protein [Candidatus Woesearchaeota archaeon]